jgi:predicted outer membrane repeat protein
VNGGAIDNSSGGSLTVKNCRFIGNVANNSTTVADYNSNNFNYGGLGAGIYNGQSSTLVVDGSYFNDNQATGLNDEIVGGGAGISNMCGTANITNSIFYKNIAMTYAASVYAQGNESAGCSAITNLSGNLHDGGTAFEGGAVYTASSKSLSAQSLTTITGDTFQNGVTRQSGGAVSCYHAKTHLINCTFTNNHCNKRDSYGGIGGAIYIDGQENTASNIAFSSVVVDGCTFANNSTVNAGGAIAMSLAHLEVNTTTFTGNTSTTAMYDSIFYGSGEVYWDADNVATGTQAPHTTPQTSGYGTWHVD